MEFPSLILLPIIICLMFQVLNAVHDKLTSGIKLEWYMLKVCSEDEQRDFVMLGFFFPV